MRKKRFWLIRPIIATLMIISVIMLVVLVFYSRVAFFVMLPFVVVLITLSLLKLLRIQQELRIMVTDMGRFITDQNQAGLVNLPTSAVILSNNGEILWYNDMFKRNLLHGGKDVFGNHVKTILNSDIEGLWAGSGEIINCCGGYFKCYCLKNEIYGETVYLVYLVDVTELEKTRISSVNRNPVIMIALIDNYEDSVVNANEGISAKIVSDVQSILQEFADNACGFIKKLSHDRYLIVMEQQSLDKVVGTRFEVLDKIREIETEGNVPVTISIGVSAVGSSFMDAEQDARQAIDMALGRGGDQAAIKTNSGYEFFGGFSKGIEKRTKVKTRVVASSMSEMITNADNVLIMGHKFADLDALGAAIGMQKACECLKKKAHIVVDLQRSLAEDLAKKFIQSGKHDIFMHPEFAPEHINEKTLLIIVDTHSTRLLESLQVYKKCKNIIVIDHHRKLVDHIDNAAIFYHEPYASSASEMVTELVQYLGNSVKLSQLEGEALLAGIMLDTRNFVLRTGVRTFEAAAFLRRIGTDTVSVRQLFSASMDSYQARSKVISSADIYKECAIAICDSDTSNLRIIAPQAADELLNISGVKASFVLYEKQDVIYVSARSMGAFNVQVMMEGLGGGGHHTMAAAQVPDSAAEAVRDSIIAIIDKQTEYNSQRE